MSTCAQWALYVRSRYRLHAISACSTPGAQVASRPAPKSRRRSSRPPVQPAPPTRSRRLRRRRRTTGRLRRQRCSQRASAPLRNARAKQSIAHSNSCIEQSHCAPNHRYNASIRDTRYEIISGFFFRIVRELGSAVICNVQSDVEISTFLFRPDLLLQEFNQSVYQSFNIRVVSNYAYFGYSVLCLYLSMTVGSSELQTHWVHCWLALRARSNLLRTPSCSMRCWR